MQMKMKITDVAIAVKVAMSQTRHLAVLWLT